MHTRAILFVTQQKVILKFESNSLSTKPAHLKGNFNVYYFSGKKKAAKKIFCAFTRWIMHNPLLLRARKAQVPKPFTTKGAA